MWACRGPYIVPDNSSFALAEQRGRMKETHATIFCVRVIFFPHRRGYVIGASPPNCCCSHFPMPIQDRPVGNIFRRCRPRLIRTAILLNNLVHLFHVIRHGWLLQFGRTFTSVTISEGGFY